VPPRIAVGTSSGGTSTLPLCARLIVLVLALLLVIDFLVSQLTKNGRRSKKSAIHRTNRLRTPVHPV
jgi:hypothetical protein